MDINSFLQLCGTIGIPGAIALYMYLQREKDKKAQNEKVEQQLLEEKKERIDLEERVKQSQESLVEKLNKNLEKSEMDREKSERDRKEDKEIFKKTVDSFAIALTEQKISNGVINNVQSELKDIKTDLTIIKEKIK